MLAMASAGYPRNLSYVVKRLSGYSRNTFKLQTLNATTAGAGQIVTVDLPSNALVDLNTLTMFFKGSTSTASGFAKFPVNIESVIERLEVEINGQLLGGGCAYYNQLWKIIADTTFGQDVVNRRHVLQNSAKHEGVPGSNTTDQQFAIHNWLGFLGSVKPSILDTSLLGNVRIRLTLASPQILLCDATAQNQTYMLNDIFFSVDTVSIDDGIFYNMHQQFLASGGVYELPFNNYFSFTSTGGFSQTLKFSLSTQSLNRTWGTFTLGGSYATHLVTGGASAYNLFGNTGTSSYFTRIGNGEITCHDASTPATQTLYKTNLQNVQFNVNGVYYPNFKPTPEQAFSLMLNSMQMSQDTLGGTNPDIKSLYTWNNGFFVHCQEYDHGTDDFISGIDTRGNIAQGTWETQAATQSTPAGAGAGPGANGFQALVFAQTTSTLRVGAGRQLEVVL